MLVQDSSKMYNKEPSVVLVAHLQEAVFVTTMSFKSIIRVVKTRPGIRAGIMFCIFAKHSLDFISFNPAGRYFIAI